MNIQEYLRPNYVGVNDARRTYTPTLSIENFGLSEDDLSTTFNADFGVSKKL